MQENVAKQKADQVKQLRRKSTSAIALSAQSDMNILGLTGILIESASSSDLSGQHSGAEEKKPPQELDGAAAAAVPPPGASPRPRKKWEYFEIGDHPKAISDKKLQQLKSKYQRRNTEPAVLAAERDREGWRTRAMHFPIPTY